jgi:hypothetical protein
MKELFYLFESNDYPLEVHSLDVTKMDGGFLSANISLITYEYDDSVTSLDSRN